MKIFFKVISQIIVILLIIAVVFMSTDFWRLYKYNFLMRWFAGSVNVTACVELRSYYEKNQKLPVNMTEIQLHNPQSKKTTIGTIFLEVFYDSQVDLEKNYATPPIIFATYNPLDTTQQVVCFDKEKKEKFIREKIDTTKLIIWWQQLETRESHQREIRKNNGASLHI